VRLPQPRSREFRSGARHGQITRGERAAKTFTFGRWPQRPTRSASSNQVSTSTRNDYAVDLSITVEAGDTQLSTA